MIWKLAVVLALAADAAWVWSAIVIDWFGKSRELRPFRWLWAELRPFYLPTVLLVIADHVMDGEMRGWQILFSAMNLASWWLFKDVDKDDRWKRRKAKLVEKVGRIGSRLVVVPAGGES